MASAVETGRSGRHSAGGGGRPSSVVVVDQTVWTGRRGPRGQCKAGSRGVDNRSSDSSAIIRRMGAELPNVVRDAGSDDQQLCALGIGSRAHERGGIIQVAQFTRSLGAGGSRPAWVGRWRSESRRDLGWGECCESGQECCECRAKSHAGIDARGIRKTAGLGSRLAGLHCSKEEARNRRRRQLGGTPRLATEPPTAEALAALRTLG